MQKTRVHEDGGKVALWNQKIIFRYIGETKLLVQCMNSNTMSDNLIGHVEIPLANLTVNNPVDQWFQIYNKKRKMSGEIKMKLYKHNPHQQAQQNMHGQIGKNILQSQLGGAMGIGVQAQQQNFQLQQQQALMQQQQQQMAAQKAAMLQQQQQQAQLQAQLQQQQQQMMMQQQANMMGGNMGMGMQPMYGGGGGMPHQPMQQAPMQQQQQQRVAVTIPYGVSGGQQIVINVPGKGQMMVTVPMGMNPGQTFQVIV